MKKIFSPIAHFFLRRMLQNIESETLTGDLKEIFVLLQRDKGIWYAKRWYRIQIFKLLGLAILFKLRGIGLMSANYLKTGIRNVKRHPGYSFINIAGLAIGMTTCLLIMLWIQDELSFDRFHTNANTLYRVGRITNTGKNTRTPVPLAPALIHTFPEVKNATRFATTTRLIKYHEKSFAQHVVATVDPTFFSIFNFNLIEGSRDRIFQNIASIVITRKFVEKNFGNESPMGKILTIPGLGEFTVMGIIQDVPNHSHMSFDCLIPFEARSALEKEILGDNNWGAFSYTTYVHLHNRSLYSSVNEKISTIIQQHRPESTSKLFLQPLTDIHLHPLEGDGNLKYLTIFSIIALFILVIACINFMNLMTARSQHRSKEVGVRKVMGARRSDLVRQFFGESLLLTLIAAIFSILLIHLSLPYFNDISGKEISLAKMNHFDFLFLIMGVVLVTGLISGIYPAVILSSFHPSHVLKGIFRSEKSRLLFRKILVVSQFSISIFLIIGATIVYKQLTYMRQANMGFEKECLIYFELNSDYRTNYELIKNDMLKHPRIINISRGAPPIWTDYETTEVTWQGKNSNEDILFAKLHVDFDYIETLKMEMVEGRTFSLKYPSDVEKAYIINEKSAQVMGMKSPVGKQLSVKNLVDDGRGIIIGVVKDFHHASFHHSILPVILDIDPEWFFFICIRIKSSRMSDTIQYIKNHWEARIKDYPFEYHFLEDTIDNFYRTEKQMEKLFNGFTFLAIFISCMGLFGLTAYMAEQRTKEIGIRKVLGATVSRIILLMSKDFMKWVIFANIFAWPVAYIIMRRWLETFAYRIQMSIPYFLFASFAAIFIAGTTIIYQSIKIAVSNPVESLRNE